MVDWRKALDGVRAFLEAMYGCPYDDETIRRRLWALTGETEEQRTKDQATEEQDAESWFPDP